jgi:GH25 family lysozyme M1 (1,4-beta-N-acetylmuramidase)
MLKYIDVSTFQGVIDWEKVRPQIDGVILRAGYGQGNVDAQFKRNVEECNRLQIPVGVYWFSYAYNAALALKEAKYCLEAIEPYRIELPVAFDWEYASVDYCKRQGVNPTPVLANKLAETFCRHIEQNGYYAMVYTNGDFLNRYFTDIKAFDLWYAAWPNAPVDPSKPPRTCGIWQWGSSTIDGISGGVDTNAAYRNYPVLIRSAGLNHLSDPEPEPPAPPEPWYAPAMRWAKEQGICDGTRPEAPATRAEVAQMIMNYHNKTK